MKKLLSSLLLLPVFAVFLANTEAQTKKPVAKKTTTSKSKKPAPAKANTTPVQVADAAMTAPAADTTKPVATAAPVKDPFAFDSVKVSLRNDASIERNMIKTRTPLAYEHIREDDAWYRHKVWREIDIREKINLPFRYKAEEDNGNQRFINILFRSIKNGDVTAVTRLGRGFDAVRLPCFHARADGVLVLPAFGEFTGGWRVDAQAGDRLYVIAGDQVLGLPPRQPAPPAGA